MAPDPEKIGPYLILDRLGFGGMATVFRAQHLRSGRLVALKTVLGDKPSHIQSIQREMRYLPRLHHPGVVRLLDSGTWEQGRPFYAMELLEGKPLSVVKSSWWPGEGGRTHSTLSCGPDQLAVAGAAGGRAGTPPPAGPAPFPSPAGADHPLPPAAGGHLDRALEIAYRLCDPLAYIHGEGIVHRDLKPSNVFIREDGAPVLLDFGVIGVFEGASGRRRLDVQRSRAGTRLYMAPEQLRGDPVDSRADLFSFGALLFELLTGHTPFEGETGSIVASRRGIPSACSRLVAGVPPEIDQLILRLMSAEPRERYGHADDLAAVLAPFVAGRLPEARAESQRPRRSVFLYRAEMAGRDELLADLAGHLQKAANGEGTLIMVSGESGVGKTHFASNLGRLASGQHHTVIVGECAPIGELGEPSMMTPRSSLKSPPLHPLRGFLRALADRCRLKDGERARMIERLLGSEGGLLAPYEPALAEVIDRPASAVDPAVPESRQALFRVLAQALVGMSQIEPLLLVLDDLQWADELTLDFLSWLPPELLAQSALVILGTYRSEESAGRLTELARRPRCLNITLNRLDAGAIGQMAGDMLAMSSVPESLTRYLVEHSEGNPFFATEYLRMAVSGGHFVREEGRWKVAAENGGTVALRDMPLPRSVSDLLGQQMDRLGPEALRVGQAAAVLGRQFDEPLLDRLLPGLGEPERQEGLHQLLRLQLVEEQATGQYRFRHDKMREALYARIPGERRRDLHRQAAEAVLARHQDRTDLPFHYAQLAHHFQQASLPALAREYLEKAAELALRQFAHGDAIRLFNQLLGLDRERPEDGTRSAAEANLLRVRWHRRLVEAHHGLGDLESTTAVGAEGLRLAGYRLPTSARGWYGCLIRNLPIQLLHRTWRSAAPRRPPSDRRLAMEAALIVQRLGQRYYFLDALAMLGSSLWSVNLAERARTSERVAMPYALLGTATGLYRMRRVSARYFALARAAAQTAGDLPGLILSYYTEATVASGQCRWADARALLGSALEHAESSGNQSEAQIARAVLANAAYFTGRFLESRQGFLQILETARGLDNQQHTAWGLYGVARAMIPLGQLAEARELLEEAWAVLLPQPELPSKIICQGLLAGVHRRLGNIETALPHADLALQLIRANNLVAYANVTGYAEAIETYLAAWQVGSRHGDGVATRRRAAQGLRYLGRLRWPLPIVHPSYLRLRGQRKWAQGRLAGARADLEKAARAARALGLPYEEAVASLGMASLVPPADQRWGRAMRRASELGAEMHCRDLRAPFGELRVAASNRSLQGGTT